MTLPDRLLDRLLDSGLLPDAVLRAAIRAICAMRLRDERRGGQEATARRRHGYLEAWHAGPIARDTRAANAQHYEVPPAFFALVLGPHRKYSACLFEGGTSGLADAEAAMLELTAARAQLDDGQRILDLGCGWGSFMLWAAERYPRAQVTGLSNSAPQRQFILAEAARRGLRNVEVVTADINSWPPDAPGARRFDRIVSIEMLEHVRNHPRLFARLAGALEPDGRMFVHVFSHRELTYPYEPEGGSDWMSRHFFSGGIMPSVDLIPSCDRDLVVEQQWVIDGTHYARTCEAWLRNLDANRAAAQAVLAEGLGPVEARRATLRWRVFFMACAELFAFRRGAEWGVSHYRLRPRSAAPA